MIASVAQNAWYVVLGLGATALAAALAWAMAKFRAFRVLIVYALIAAAFVGLIVLRVVLPSRVGTTGLGLPLFGPRVWDWMLLFVAIALGVVVYLGFWLEATLRRAREEAGASRAEFPDLDAAWDEILVRLDQAQIDLARQRVFLVLAPDEGWSAALVHSAGLNIFARAPEVVAPIHAYATADGVWITCAGASGLGRQDAEGFRRLESLCDRLLAIDPECPIVRGIAVLFPADWAAQPDAPKSAALVRDDLRTIQRALKVRCPVYAIFPQIENTPGFPEFLSRMPDAVKQNRCGFAIPSSRAFSASLVNDGLVWLSGWFHTWILSQMSEDLLNHEGNNRLFSLDDEIRRSRRPWRNVLESAFSTHAQGDPLLFRGCYCVASGETPDLHAFSAGLLSGPRARILADHTATVWAPEAEAEDRRSRKLALAVALGGAALVFPTWAYIATFPGYWWIGLVAMILAWVLAILGRSLRA